MKRLIAAFTTALFLSTATARTASDYVDFLYSHITIADSLDYTREFYIRNVEAAMRARAEMPWGASVPEREFLHFVLPVRVNNEHLDESRMVFYEELAPRIKNMSMEEAVLEVNHWLHEKATYRPSDSRTSPPLSTVKTSFGRCGEESTLGVAAMRSVGIPARQVYTPRWAHTDDNHAWVEVWVNGKWYFLGACEPEPILNLAWFNAPAARGMLMTTNALNGYDGPEEVIGSTPLSTQINVTENYAPVDTARVNVTDTAGKAVAGATVRFMLYNYGEFYPLSVKTADDAGNATLTTGLGDLLVWATAPDEQTFGFTKYSVGTDKSVYIVLDKDNNFSGTVELNIVPPRQSGSLPVPTAEQAAENARRFSMEDSIRNAYMSTFFTPESASAYAADKGWSNEAARLLPLTYGNHATVTAFLDAASDHELAVEFLNSLSEKDLRDIEPEVLSEFYTENIPAGIDRTLYVKYIMCPRVSNETLTLYRSYFLKAFTEAERKAYAADPQSWLKWIESNIKTAESGYPRNIHISPAQVCEHRMGIPPPSRDIFTVASLRSFGVPAYLDQVTMRPHYFSPSDGTDIEIVFSDANTNESASTPKGRVRLAYTQTGRIDNPAYYTHFTMSSITGGAPVLMNFADDASWKNDFADGVEVDAGQTLLVSGQRMADGSVLARADFFNVKKDCITEHRLIIRQDTTAVQVVGNFNSENIYHDLALDTDKSLLSTTGRGYYIIGLIRPGHEPSAHILNDISTYASDLEAWGGKIVLLFSDAESADRFRKSDFHNLPANIVFGTDIDGRISAEMAQFGSNKPLILIADTFNRVVFISEGYTINIGRTLLDTIHKLNI